MQTFENIYKLNLKEKLKKFLDKEIIISNDISHEPLRNNENAIVAVIKTGIGQPISNNAYDLINTTFTVTFIIDSNELQTLLGALTSLIWNYNGKWDQLDLKVYNIENEELEIRPYIFRPIFTTPVPLGGLIEVQGRTKTFTVAMAMFNISVGYSSNADLIPDEFKLVIDNEEYVINAVRYDMTNSPSYEAVMLSDSKIPYQNYLSENIVFSFRLLKTLPGKDPLQDILASQFFGDDFMSQKQLKLKRGSEEIDIQIASVEEIYELGTKVLVLTLTR